MDIRSLDELHPQEVEALVARNREAFREVLPQVQEIVAQVRAEGDEALRRFTRAFDGVDLLALEAPGLRHRGRGPPEGPAESRRPH